MMKPMTRALLCLLAMLLTTGLFTACSSGSSPAAKKHTASGAPSGATMIPGGPMESTPAVPSPKIPASQEEAQNTVIHYIQQTVDALPAGSNVDGTRYSGVGSGIAYCEDEPKDQNSPVNYAYWGDLNLPPGTDVNAVFGQVESIWKRWGWQVLERQGFEKPNRFGYAPDGYIVQIKAAYPPGSPPTIIGTSPCFPGNLRKEGAPVPTAINQTTPAR